MIQSRNDSKKKLPSRIFVIHQFNGDDTINTIASDIQPDDSILTRTDPRANAYMYYLLDIFHKICGKFDIRYWAECGTALGYKRHGGIIPWDDDIDVDIHPSDLSKLSGLEIEEEFSTYGCALCPIYFGYRVCPISLPTFGKSVNNNTTRNVVYKWPFLDVFATTFFDKSGSGVLDHIRYRDQDALKWWPDYFLTNEEIQRKQVDFGPKNMKIKIFVPGKLDEYLTRIYGKNHMTVAYRELDHANNKAIEKVICTVHDREPGQAIRAELPESSVAGRTALTAASTTLLGSVAVQQFSFGSRVCQLYPAEADPIA